MNLFLSKERTYIILLFVVLLPKAAWVSFAILYAQIGLGPDEAQYWTWSQELAFGYYSKPPGIAWEIWSGTALFGASEFGVRFGAQILGFVLPLAIYSLARASSLSVQAAFWAAMIFACSPIGIMAAFLAITDTGMVFFWTIAAALTARNLRRSIPCYYYALGACIACGALFKWLMYEFWLVAFLAAFFWPEWRSKKMLGGLGISLLGLLPSLAWNAEHDWATFRHVGATIWVSKQIDSGTTALMKGNFFEFLGAQVILLSPILFGLFCGGLAALWQRRRQTPSPLVLCGLISFGLLAAYSLVAIFKQMQGNWVDFAYPTAAVVTSWYAYEYRPRLRNWLFGGIGLSLFLCGFAFALPLLQSNAIGGLPYKINPFRHNVGWKDLHVQLLASGYDPAQDFLFADKYQNASLLSFYGPQQKRAYFFNLQGLRKNQFSYWPGMDQEQKGKTGYFALIENMPLEDERWEALKDAYLAKLSAYFSEVHSLELRPIFFANGKAVKAVMFFKGVNYNGLTPPDSNIY